MLTPEEIEAVVLGAQLVAKLPDPYLASSARDVVAKVALALPERLRPVIAEPSVGAKPPDRPPAGVVDLRPFRSAIRAGLKLRLRYRGGAGEETERTVWPVLLGYAETHSLLIAWCELRNGFRHFRTDRILTAEVPGESIAVRRSELRRRWERWREAERIGTAAN